jgi:hypothetical protein
LNLCVFRKGSSSSTQGQKNYQNSRFGPISDLGIPRALSQDELPDPMNTTSKNNQALETLVLAQLASIRKREADLQTRLQSNAALEPNVAAEVWQLQTSADRLSRMMDAMNFGGAQAAAFAA